ncbi:MAG TPA: phosphatase PAP2 family protein [Symbiobacteriaceae bacterium]|nr:phosphatase PAP2 family protein [Symbiobacteriaceae bacterium]
MTGLDILHAIQSIHSPLLDTFFYAMTQLHQETFYVLVLPLLYWLYDKRFARYMVSVFLLGFWANNVLKFSFNTARPSPKDVRVIHPETGGGPAFPSGHSQNPLMFWGALAAQWRKPWFTALATVIIFLIGYSRLYLGLHWPLDVVGGWAIGAVMLYGFAKPRRFWTGEGMSFGQQALWAVVIPLITLSLSLVKGYTVAWDTPKAMADETWALTGAYMGFWLGAVLEERFVGFDPRQGTVVLQVTKVITGLALVFAVKEGFKVFLPANALGDLLRYGCMTLAATYVVPWIFRRFGHTTTVGRAVSR